MKHLINSQDFSRKDYDELLRRSMKFINNGIPTDLCTGKIVATLFFQPSTRTQTAFQSAMLRSGGGWVGISGVQGISMEKGESFEDTVREYGNFADVIVLRHPDDDSADRARDASQVPVINGGSGSREHAMGAGIMLVSIAHYLKRPIEGAKIGIYGTPEINRCCKAMVPLFGMYGIDLVIDDLGAFPLPKQVEEDAKKQGLKSLTYDKLDNWIGDVDVLICTRGMQKGIIPDDQFPKEKEEAILKRYKPITTEHMKKLRKDAILSMLLPRIFEIEKDVDKDPRSIYAQYEPFVESALAYMTFVLDIPVA